MRTKNFVMIGLFALGLFVFNGCYTQMAKPDPNEDEAVAAEEQQAETEDQAQEEGYATPYETNVYVNGGYGYPYYYDPFWSPYYPYRSGVYVHIGSGGYYNDPWSWCGSPWYYNWDCGYYGRYSWGPGYGGYYYPHNYYGRHYDDDQRYPVKQRGFGRRGRNGDDTPVVVASGTNNSRPSLSKTRPVVYTRDNSGTLVRRARRGSSTDNPTSGRDSVTPVKSGNYGDRGRRTSKDSGSESSGTTVDAAPRKQPSSGSGPAGKSGSSDGTRVRKQGPPASSGGSSAPPQKRSSGGSVTKQSGSSGNSGSGTQSSGTSGGGSRRTRKP